MRTNIKKNINLLSTINVKNNRTDLNISIIKKNNLICTYVSIAQVINVRIKVTFKYIYAYRQYNIKRQK